MCFEILSELSGSANRFAVDSKDKRIEKEICK